MKVIELPVGELKAALAGLNKVVNSKAVLPVLGCVRIQPHPEGVSLQVTDLDSFASYRINAESPTDFPPCAVSLATLAKVVKTGKDRISLIHEGDQRFKVRHLIGRTPVEQPIDSLPIEDWPSVPQINAKPFLVEQGFKDAFRQAVECVSVDCSRLILNGVCLDITQPDCHCVVGTDGRHLFSANTFHFPLTESLVIPSRRFLAWSGFAADGDWLLAVEPSVPQAGEVEKPAYIQIQAQHWTFVTRRIDGQYPNWRQIMPDQNRLLTRVILADEAVGAVLDALPRMPGTEDANQPVTMILQAGQLILRSRPQYTDQWAEVPVPGATVIGSDQRVCLNRTFVTKALRFGFTECEVQDALSPVVFTATGKKLLAMIMRSDDAPATAQDEAQPTQPSPQPAAAPTEAAQAAHRPPLRPDNPTEQNTAMETMNNITTLPAPERGNLKSTNGNTNGEPATALKAVVDQVERIKTNLREVISDLNNTLDLLKAAEKEKKATFKEVESIRATLRSLQKMEL